MPARAIIDLPEIPYSYSRRCSGCNYYIDGCYGSVCGLGEYDGYCAFREVPEWTEEDTITLHAMLKVLQRSYQLWTKYDIKEPDAGNVLKRQEMLLKLCKLARVEVEG